MLFLGLKYIWYCPLSKIISLQKVQLQKPEVYHGLHQFKMIIYKEEVKMYSSKDEKPQVEMVEVVEESTVDLGTYATDKSTEDKALTKRILFKLDVQ